MRVRARVGDELFERVAGPDGARQQRLIHTTPGPRWFSDDSAIVRVHGDAAMFVGGIRAILLQSLHPVAMAAVSTNSRFRQDMWGRLARTSHFIAVTTFGNEEAAGGTVDRVRAIHERIRGVTPEGTPYAASDPHLLEWIHVAQIDSFLTAHARYGLEPLDAAGRDDYVAQIAVIGKRLGIPDPPTTYRQVEEAMARYRPELRGTPGAREAVRFLLNEPDLPATRRPAYDVLTSAAVALLPRWTRDELGLPDRPWRERAVSLPVGGAAIKTIRWALCPTHEQNQRVQWRVTGPTPPSPRIVHPVSPPHGRGAPSPEAPTGGRQEHPQGHPVTMSPASTVQSSSPSPPSTVSVPEPFDARITSSPPFPLS